MNSRNSIHIYKGKAPFYALPVALILGLVVFGILAIFGLFIGIIAGALFVLFGVLRLFSGFGKKKQRRVEDDGTTIVLEEKDYKVIDIEK